MMMSLLSFALSLCAARVSLQGQHNALVRLQSRGHTFSVVQRPQVTCKDAKHSRLFAS